MSRSSTLGLCIALCSLAPARAAIITVTSDSSGTGGPDCTIRDAITAANTDTPTGGCPAGNGADTIELPFNAIITLTEVDNDPDPPFSATGLPSVTSVVTINGNWTTVQRHDSPSGGTPNFRIIRVAGDGDLTVNGLTISNGSIPSGAGGGILNSDATLTLTNSNVGGNRSFAGGGIFNTGTLTLTNSTISGNTASLCVPECFGVGGGIWSNGTVTLTNSTVSGNSADVTGGGILNSGAAMLIDSTVCGNTPDQIAGPWTDGGGNLIADECPPTGSCCATDDCVVRTEEDCAAIGGEYAGDGTRCVGPFDLAQLLGWWGPCEPADPCHEVDADANGNIGPLDLAVLLGAWGPCPS